MLLKAVGLATSLLIVPITIDYLSSEVYGIWLTISSILYWMGFFDVGLSNGMRNYLARAIALEDYRAARSYVSTTLTMMAAIAAIVGVLCLLPLSLMNFQTLFNTTVLSASQLREAIAISVLFTLVLFVVRTFGMVYIALQKYAVNDAINVTGHLLALAVIWVLTKTTSGNLTYVVLALTAIPLAVYLAAAVPLFRHHPELRPSAGSFDRAAVSSIVGKGLGFFLIQITSCLVIFGGSNLIITQYCGPEAVTVYNIAYKYFSVLTIGYAIVLAPMWSAYTDAYAKGDMAWIDKTFRRALLTFGLTALGGMVMLALSGYVYELWVGERVHIPFTVSLSVLLYVLAFNMNCCVTNLLNGLNTIFVQILTSVLFTAVYLAVVLWKGPSLGITGIAASMAACYAAMSIIHLYQCRRLVSGTASGIWKR
jgi:O-antigen/teichoic acid export membrane protein